MTQLLLPSILLSGHSSTFAINFGGQHLLSGSRYSYDQLSLSNTATITLKIILSLYTLRLPKNMIRHLNQMATPRYWLDVLEPELIPDMELPPPLVPVGNSVFTSLIENIDFSCPASVRYSRIPAPIRGSLRRLRERRGDLRHASWRQPLASAADGFDKDNIQFMGCHSSRIPAPSEPPFSLSKLFDPPTEPRSSFDNKCGQSSSEGHTRVEDRLAQEYGSSRAGETIQLGLDCADESPGLTEATSYVQIDHFPAVNSYDAELDQRLLTLPFRPKLLHEVEQIDLFNLPLYRHDGSISSKLSDEELDEPSTKSSKEMLLPEEFSSIYAPANHHPDLLAYIFHAGDADATIPISYSIPPASTHIDATESAGILPIASAGSQVNEQSTKLFDQDRRLEATEQYRDQRGHMWARATSILQDSFLHPAHLTELEFVELVTSQATEATAWLEHNRPQLLQRAVGKWMKAHSTLLEAGIYPNQLDENFLDVFECMEASEQDAFIENFTRLESQMSPHQGRLVLTSEEEYLSELAPAGSLRRRKAMRGLRSWSKERFEERRVARLKQPVRIDRPENFYASADGSEESEGFGFTGSVPSDFQDCVVSHSLDNPTKRPPLRKVPNIFNENLCSKNRNTFPLVQDPYASALKDEITNLDYCFPRTRQHDPKAALEAFNHCTFSSNIRLTDGMFLGYRKPAAKDWSECDDKKYTVASISKEMSYSDDKGVPLKYGVERSTFVRRDTSSVISDFMLDAAYNKEEASVIANYTQDAEDVKMLEETFANSLSDDISSDTTWVEDYPCTRKYSIDSGICFDTDDSNRHSAGDIAPSVASNQDQAALKNRCSLTTIASVSTISLGSVVSPHDAYDEDTCVQIDYGEPLARCPKIYGTKQPTVESKAEETSSLSERSLLSIKLGMGNVPIVQENLHQTQSHHIKFQEPCRDIRLSRGSPEFGCSGYISDMNFAKNTSGSGTHENERSVRKKISKFFGSISLRPKKGRSLGSLHF